MVFSQAVDAASSMAVNVDRNVIDNVVEGVGHLEFPGFGVVGDDGGEEVGFDGEGDIGEDVAGFFVLIIKGIKAVTEFFQGFAGGHAGELGQDVFFDPIAAGRDAFFGEEFEAGEFLTGAAVEDEGGGGEGGAVEGGGFAVENEDS